MALTKNQKSERLEDIVQILKENETIAFVQFDKLTMAQSQAFRRALRAEGVGFKTVKKTLLEKACEKIGMAEMPTLEGQIGIAYGTDKLAPAREVFNFQKTAKDIISLVGGVFESTFKDKASITMIATIPPMDTLRGMFLNLINTPRSGFAIVINEYAKTK
jgi:ribosomal protein L10